MDLQNNAPFRLILMGEILVKIGAALAEVINKDNPAISPLPFIRMARSILAIERKGWMKRGMDPSNMESNASHSWGVAVICLLFSPKVYNVLRISFISLIRIGRSPQILYPGFGI